MEKERICLPEDIQKIIPSLRGITTASQMERALKDFHNKLDVYKKARPDIYPNILSLSILGLLEMKKGNKFKGRIDSSLLSLILQDELYSKEGIVESLIDKYSNMIGVNKFEKGLFLEKVFLQMEDRDPERGGKYVSGLINKYRDLYYNPDVEFRKADIGDLGTVITGYYPTTPDFKKRELQENLWNNGIDYDPIYQVKGDKGIIEFTIFEMSDSGIKEESYGIASNA